MKLFYASHLFRVIEGRSKEMKLATLTGNVSSGKFSNEDSEALHELLHHLFQEASMARIFLEFSKDVTIVTDE